MIEIIVSGGQTGVDRAALDAALALKIPHGGWCPKGRAAELNTTIPAKYNLQETKTEDVNERTKLNIRDSDGTLIFVPTLPLPSSIVDGTRLTIKEANETNKPNLIINLSDPNSQNVDHVISWLREHNIKKLNIAGPRESSCPGIYDLSLKFLNFVLPICLNTPTMRAKL